MPSNNKSEEVRAKMEKVWDRARVVLERGRDEIAKISQVGKLKFDLTKLQRERTDLYQELGQQTYRLLKENQFDPAEVEKLLVRIDRVTEKILSQREAIEITAKTKRPTRE